MTGDEKRRGSRKGQSDSCGAGVLLTKTHHAAKRCKSVPRPQLRRSRNGAPSDSISKYPKACCGWDEGDEGNIHFFATGSRAKAGVICNFRSLRASKLLMPKQPGSFPSFPAASERGLSPRLPPVATAPDISDGEAVAEVLRGNREMFEVLVRRHNARLFRLGMAYLRGHAPAEDAMQNTYLKAFLHLGRFQRGAAFATWLTRIMINECLMTLRRRRLASPDGREAPLEDPALPAADPLTLKEMKAVLEHAIAALPQNYRVVYVLREVQQLSTAETAVCLGLTADTVKVRLLRARERLKAELLKSAAGAELFPYPAIYCDGMTVRVLRSILAIG